MDKRWIIILIILIVGCSCMYLVVNSSYTVGDAITVVNKSVVTLPDGFGIGNSEKNSVELINKNNDEKIYIYDLGKKDNALEQFNSVLDTLESDQSIVIIENSTLNINNITTYKISLQNFTEENVTNSTFAYFYSYNHTFFIEMKDYSKNDNLNDDLDFLVRTIQPDFKQAQD